MFLSATAPRLVIDPFDSALTNTPGAVTFSNPRRATNNAGDNWRAAATARFVPTDPDDLDTLNSVYAWAFAHFPRMVWTNECADTMPAAGYPLMAKRYINQGAKRQLGHLGETQRPRDIMRALIANAHHLIVFALPNPDDVKHLADVAGLPRGTLAGELDRLGRYEFVYCNLIERSVTPCPAIRL